ncbi:9733_t:CDS:1, partial [Paraglomus brasilianum]
PGVSQQCEASLQGVLTDKNVIACYDISTLLSGAPPVTTADVEKLETQFLDQFCTNPACSEDVFKTAFSPVVTACGTNSST